ncbi:pyridoxamine 5'-phosphate oxidase family protein [Phaeacidiphilus oryzae]|uniref:pyridoxamine 5'-phosphate oxidase family protein n=1 Tax=Phaeacidiphilus oryzae TaxID=348818 RepID=UPI00056BD821|nr:pyridoxamine 5'-phosphate oxidase family protein [Phaeacidiphilus oryzae]
MPLKPEERARLLDEPLIAVLSVASGEPGRGPIGVPVWYLAEESGDLVLVTGRSSRKARLLEAAGRATLTVQREEPTYRWASAEGPVEFVPADAALVARIAARYLPPGAAESYAAGTDPAATVGIRLRPERWAGADLGSVS